MHPFSLDTLLLSSGKHVYESPSHLAHQGFAEVPFSAPLCRRAGVLAGFSSLPDLAGVRSGGTALTAVSDETSPSCDFFERSVPSLCESASVGILRGARKRSVISAKYSTSATSCGWVAE